MSMTEVITSVADAAKVGTLGREEPSSKVANVQDQRAGANLEQKMTPPSLAA